MLNILLRLGIVGRAFAADGTNPTVLTLPNLFNPCTDATCLMTKLFSGLLTISVPILVLFVFIAAFQMLTAGGDEEKFKKGRKTLLYAVVGFAIVLVGSVVSSLIQDIMSGGLGAIT